jgi:hypothetical protein
LKRHLPTIPAIRPIVNTLPRLDHRQVDSSHVKSVGYDAAQSHLQVTFKDGSSYDYAGVPPLIYDQFINAPSKGAFMREVLRTRFRSIKRVGP